MFQKISPKVFAFISRNSGSNCFLLLGEKEKALVDSSTEENKEAIMEGLKALGLKPKSISLILHTHGHVDHFGLDFLFPKAKIAMHEADAEQVNKGNKEFACAQFFPNMKFPKISVFLKDKQEIDLGGLKLHVIHTPGHTEGSACFLLKPGNSLFSGDTLFSGGFGRTDLPSGNSQKMLFSLKKLQKTAFKGLFPGHGPILLGKEDNARQQQLQQIIEIASTNSFL